MAVTFDVQAAPPCWIKNGSGNPLRRSSSTVWKRRRQRPPRRRYDQENWNFTVFMCFDVIKRVDSVTSKVLGIRTFKKKKKKQAG